MPKRNNSLHQYNAITYMYFKRTASVINDIKTLSTIYKKLKLKVF